MDIKAESKQSFRRRRRAQKRPIRTERTASLCDGLLVLVVVGSALAIGTVHVPALLAISALAFCGAACELMALRRVPWPAAVLAALGLFSALQAIRMPAAWVSRMSPASADVWSRCLAPFGEPALRVFPLSLDPSASIVEALKWLTYACVYIMAMRARVRHGSALLATALFGSVALVSLITLVHGVANLPELYGLYHPNFNPGRWSVGPLLNSNNLAGYAILGLFTGGGLLLSGRAPVPRIVLMVGVGVICASLSLSGSRAGVLSVFIAGIVALALLSKAKGAGVSVRGLALGIAPFVMGVVVAIALGFENEAGQLANLDVERKVRVWLWSLPLIREHALFGVGRGAFETAFQPYRGSFGYDWSNVVTHAENFVVQWIAEWGVPVGSCAVVMIVGHSIRQWYVNRNDRLRFMVMTGLLALLLQNLADLGLEIPALAIAAILALAAGERSARAREATKPLGRLAFVVLSPVVAAWVAAFVWSRSPVELERRDMSVRYRELATADDLANTRAKAPASGSIGQAETATADEAANRVRIESGQFQGRLRQAILRHPAEAYFPLLGSLVSVRMHDGKALAWLARAMELAPTNGPVHFELADLMHQHGAVSQAMLHLRLAAQYDRTLLGAVSARASAWAPSVDLLMQAIPEGSYGDRVLLDACTKTPVSERKLDCLRRAAQRNPRSLSELLVLSESLLAAIKAQQPPCKDALAGACAAEAEVAIRSAARLDPNAWRPSYLLSKVLLTRGDAVGAAQLLTRTCPHGTDGDECWHEALAAAVQGGAMDTISAAANGWGARPCVGMEACASLFASLATALESAGHLALASKFFSKAAEAEPSATRWLKVGSVAAKAHLNGIALAALDKANRSFDASPASRAEVELLRDRVERPTDTAP